MDLRDEARRMMGESCAAFPLNWCAWLELASLSQSYQQVDELNLPDHWIKAFFYAHMDLELQRNKQGLARYQELSTLFPDSHYVQSQMALASYNMRDFNKAQGLFEKILKEDPYRLDNLDTYSNILYVREQKTQLSFVAHNALRNEKYRPETCCIVGNYYSLKSQHEKAVLYFKRALQLNHQYLSAWTLMGHEYVEMRNTAAAIEAYRRALDITQRDYRAW
jgi:anaphase-promoting complex subunit 8